MWGSFFGEFQCLPVDDCSAVSSDSGALARGSAGEINFKDKQKLKDFTTNLVFTRNVKGTSLSRKEKPQLES